VRPGYLRLVDADRDHLVVAGAALGVEVSPEVVANLVRFADILDLWSRTTNLVSCHSSRELLDRHILDSMAVSPLMAETGRIVDLGSGAGFPGVPLAILRPLQSFVLVESRHKRGSFLSEVRRTLSLANVEVVVGRAENPPPRFVRTAGAVVSRAVWGDHVLTDIADPWLAEDGVVIRMRSEAQAPLIDPDKRFVLSDSVQYQIGDARPRYLDLLRRQHDGHVPRETRRG
jgi:16S rRNA (guanine527-N7)-methyltransferase